MFVNNDSRAHEPSSNPHPSHTQCPELNIGSLAPGQSRESGADGRWTHVRLHDHLDSTNAAMQGTIQMR